MSQTPNEITAESIRCNGLREAFRQFEDGAITYIEFVLKSMSLVTAGDVAEYMAMTSFLYASSLLPPLLHKPFAGETVFLSDLFDFHSFGNIKEVSHTVCHFLSIRCIYQTICYTNPEWAIKEGRATAQIRTAKFMEGPA
jgi:hypothetical protein